MIQGLSGFLVMLSACTLASPAKYALEKTAFLATYAYILYACKHSTLYPFFQVPCILLVIIGTFFELLQFALMESSNNVMETWKKIEKLRAQKKLSMYLETTMTLHGTTWLQLLQQTSF